MTQVLEQHEGIVKIKDKIITLPMVKGAILVYKRDQGNPEAKAFYFCEKVGNMIEVFEYNRATRRMNMGSVGKMDKVKAKDVIPVVTRDLGARSVAECLDDPDRWSNPEHNIMRHFLSGNIRAFISGQVGDKRTPLLDQQTLREFVKHINGSTRETWNLSEIPLVDLESRTSAIKLAKKHRVSPGTIRAKRHALGIPPAHFGSLGKHVWAKLWNEYNDTPLSEFLSPEEIEEVPAKWEAYQKKLVLRDKRREIRAELEKQVKEGLKEAEESGEIPTYKGFNRP